MEKLFTKKVVREILRTLLKKLSYFSIVYYNKNLCEIFTEV